MDMRFYGIVLWLVWLCLFVFIGSELGPILIEKGWTIFDRALFAIGTMFLPGIAAYCLSRKL